MKLSKQLKTDLAKAFQCAMEVSILDMKAPLRYINQYIAEDVSGFGTAADEKVQLRADFKKMVLDARRQAKGMLFKARIITPYRPKFIDETTAQFRDEMIVEIGDKKYKHSIHLWFSTLFKYRNNKWQMLMFHGSMPDVGSSSADTFHVAEAEKKLKELEQVVAERTADLQKKSRELEIEASLERVRAIAMSMKEQADMLKVCKSISQQLTKLGIKDIRNVQTVIINNNNGTYLNYEYFPEAKKEIITPIEYNKHKTIKAFIRKILSSKDAFFTTTFKGAKLKDWLTYQRKSKQFVTPSSLKANSLNYYFYSIGQGALGLSSYSSLGKLEFEFFHRFRNVFDLAYKRFTDIEKAEAQAREAKIQLALERVRAKTMAMQKPQELVDVINVIGEQFIELGFDIEWVNFGANRLDIAEGIDTWNFAVIPGGDSVSSRLFIPRFNHPLFIDAAAQIENYRRTGNDFFIITYNKVDKDRWLRHLFSKTLFKDVPDKYKTVQYAKLGYTTSNLALKDTFLSIGKFDRRNFTDEQNTILKRFGNAFGQAFTRFLDLQKAEAQAREAQIEAGLERVRANAMAMQSSEELKTLIGTVFTELTKLDLALTRCIIWVFEPTTNAAQWWMVNSEEPSNPMSFFIKYHKHPAYLRFVREWENQNVKFVYDLKGTDKRKWDDILFNETELKTLPTVVKNGMKQPERVLLSASFNNFGGINVASLETLSDEHFDILLRFAKVFDLTYTRFLDLQKAEAQAREAQIEAALERVRSRSLAVHASTEFNEVIKVVFKNLKDLGMEAGSVSINTFIKNSNDNQVYISDGNHVINYLLPYFENPISKDRINAKAKQTDFFSKTYNKEEKDNFYKILLTNSGLKNVPDEIKKIIRGSTLYTMSYAVARHSMIVVNDFAGNVLSQDNIDIVKRFSKVFEQSYVRFLDLQKAEVQARESQIQLALERVRARTMAMQRSDELTDAAALLFKQVGDLGITTWTTGFNVWSEDNNFYTDYVTNPQGGFIEPYIVDTSSFHVFTEMSDAKKRGDDFYVHYEEGELLAETYRHLSKFGEKQFKAIQDLGFQFPEKQYEHVVFGTKASLIFITYEPVPEAHDIFKRFGKVFEQTYTRFLDLQKAEAQAREAQIEVALEKVRTSTMTMHKSEDLAHTAVTLFTQIRELGNSPDRISIAIIQEEAGIADMWLTNQSGSENTERYILNLHEKTVVAKLYKGWQAGLKSMNVDLTGEEFRNWLSYVRSTGLIVKDEHFNNRRVHNVAFFNQGWLNISSLEPVADEMLKILERFAAVYNLTYTRFLDLQKAEFNAKEAIKQAALDRIRADIASMRTFSDLDRITPIIWNELSILGISFIRCGVFIMDDEEQLIHTFLSTPEGKAIAAFQIQYCTPGNIKRVVGNWHKNKNYIDHWDKNEFTVFAEMLVAQKVHSTTDAYLKTIPNVGIYLHFLPFLQGMLYVGNTNKLSEDELNLIQSVADAFSTAYARYEDFNKLEAAKNQADSTLIELRSTQSQLIQSEKMASLGELTAGIAHEIQNPLNFVNNFSEVSIELLDEMKEAMAKGDSEEARDIMQDVIENLEKINHHGKRAGGIVKGMLQHSRTSTGQKELTDINELCDEYLRLSYHGLRAKDKSFNAKFETDFDPSLPKINVVPQEIGRVILNLINNAFYATNERKKLNEKDYEPYVTVSTSRFNSPLPRRGAGGEVEIRVKDNGTGIHSTIKDKIFQPFFTTKPTGQGTGLGLSLAYDIVKAHGGELKVETKEGEGTIFIIHLPNN